ncbi:MAG: SDR family oxidoreductase [Leptospira sp.]|nr:SDR family oxidoreductase [Leptospira sp.]
MHDNDNLKVAKKRFLIIGCAQGHGQFIATRLMQQGHSLIMLDAKDDIINLGEEFKKENPNISAHIFNVLNFSDYDNFLKKVIGSNGIDGVLYFPRFRAEADFMKITPEEWQLDIDIGVKGIFFLSRSLIPYLNPKLSSIILYSSLLSSLVGSESVSYHVSKAGLEQLCRYMAVKFAPINIRVNTIKIGICLKDGVLNSGVLKLQPRWEIFKKIQPSGQFSHSEDLSNLTNFLLSDSIANITGQIFTLDGGLSIQEHSFMATSAFLENDK